MRIAFDLCPSGDGSETSNKQCNYSEEDQFSEVSLLAIDALRPAVTQFYIITNSWSPLAVLFFGDYILICTFLSLIGVANT